MKSLLHLRRLWILLCVPAALILTLCASNSTSFAEWYATTIYPVYASAVHAVMALAPFSVAEILILAAVAAVIVFLLLFLIRLIRNPEKRGLRAAKAGINLLCVGGALWFLFTISCGINYHRVPFSAVCGLTVQDSSKEELSALCAELAGTLSDLRDGLPEDSEGVMQLAEGSVRDTAEHARETYARLAASYPTLPDCYRSPKPVLFSRAMSWANITGVFFPFTFEANVNVDIPDYSIPSTMCHELTHLRGYMREDEANFIAFLACRASDFPEFQYSGAMLAFIHANNALFSIDRDLGSETYAMLSEGVKRDLAANSRYWKQFEGPVAEASEAVNDTYLKANRQEDGVKSYGRMVDLLLADYRFRKEMEDFLRSSVPQDSEF